jgi:hypothetical protein
MKRSLTRLAFGVLALGLIGGATSGCSQKAEIPPDMMARIEAAANRAEAAANKAEASARSAADSAARAEAAANKVGSGFRAGLRK